ncbi:unnamed protein product [Microthlaspi erraticum]|uniref:Uncharacterized protein n=1 Tax=Microthlaspi erraticum TaxID=1685480 RepID=A0A6D2KSN3_9BRAS|nr:unnamed protein product [Microthlaspi erraticum]
MHPSSLSHKGHLGLRIGPKHQVGPTPPNERSRSSRKGIYAFAHHKQTGAIIPALMHRIPSELCSWKTVRPYAATNHFS